MQTDRKDAERTFNCFHILSNTTKNLNDESTATSKGLDARVEGHILHENKESNKT